MCIDGVKKIPKPYRYDMLFSFMQLFFLSYDLFLFFDTLNKKKDT